MAILILPISVRFINNWIVIIKIDPNINRTEDKFLYAFFNLFQFQFYIESKTNAISLIN